MLCRIAHTHYIFIQSIVKENIFNIQSFFYKSKHQIHAKLGNKFIRKVEVSKLPTVQKISLMFIFVKFDENLMSVKKKMRKS